MSTDLLTVLVFTISFSLFLIIHMLGCRWMDAEDVLKTLWRTCALTMMFPIVLTIVLFFLKVSTLSTLAWVCVAFFATALHGALCFVYVLCVFGPYETSVRMRLLREIKTKSQGLTDQELRACYNHEVISQIRLRRLIGSDYMKENNGVYSAGNATNVFFLFDVITAALIRMIGKK